MNAFLNLPNENIVQICENLSLESLGRIRTSNWQMYNVCKGVLVSKIVQDVLNREVIFRNPNNSSVLSISVYQIGNNLFLDVDQDTRAPWPLGNFISYYLESGERYSRENKVNI